MKKILCLLLCAITVLGLVSCGSASIKGKWEFGANNYEFNDDGTFTSIINTLTQSGTYTAEDGKLTLTYKNLAGMETTTELTYTIEKNTLKLTGDVTLLGTGLSQTIEYTKAK